MLFISPLFFGFLAAIGALIVELFVFSFFIQDPSAQADLTKDINFVFAIGGLWFLLISAFIEEILKYILLKKTLLDETSPRHTLSFLVLFSIGFSGLETTLLISSSPEITLTVITHIVGVLLLHFSTISLLGYIIVRPALKKFTPFFILLALCIHFFYNVAILYQDALHI